MSSDFLTHRTERFNSAVPVSIPISKGQNPDAVVIVLKIHASTALG